LDLSPIRLGTGVNDATPTIPGNGAAIAHDQPAALSLSATISQYFIGGMMPESANPMQPGETIIEIRVLNADGSIKDVIRLDGSTRNDD